MQALALEPTTELEPEAALVQELALVPELELAPELALERVLEPGELAMLALEFEVTPARLLELEPQLQDFAPGLAAPLVAEL